MVCAASVSRHAVANASSASRYAAQPSPCKAFVLPGLKAAASSAESSGTASASSARQRSSAARAPTTDLRASAGSSSVVARVSAAASAAPSGGAASTRGSRGRVMPLLRSWSWARPISTCSASTP
jgi:hypothetical protein